MSLLEVLARVQLTSKTSSFPLSRGERAGVRGNEKHSSSFVNLLRRESVNLPWGATLTVITGRESQALFDTLVYLKRAGFAVALILVQPAPPPTGMPQRADLPGVPVHRVWTEQELEAWR